MKTQELESLSRNIRLQLNDIIKKTQTIKNDKLPKLDAAFFAAEKLLHQEQYDVVVCGEVKKGKSSFINALMGEEVLPTNTQVATSQVFRIINSDREEYSLVFTDGQKKAITKKELAKYGSQVDADLYGEPIFRNHQLDYIEVKHPIPALPKSVALVDTPGIGAVYAAHEQITRNYLNKAAAVIFVIDPKTPIVKQEIDFIKSALKVTKQIMFVMTKMDNYDEGVVATMISRDEEILRKETTIQGCTILPISSTLLFDATKDNDDILLEMSRFDEIKEHLLKVIYRTIGFEINATIYNSLNNYNTCVLHALEELYKSATSQPSISHEIAEKKKLQQQQFMQQWGGNGTKIREINEKIEKQLRGLENEVRSLFSTNNSIFKNMQSEIENISDRNEAERLSRSMGNRLGDSYGKAWKDIMERCEEGIESILVDCNVGLSTSETGLIHIDSFSVKERTFADRLMSGRNSYFTGAFVAGVFAIPLSIVAAPITLAVAAIGSLLGIWAGVASKKDAELKQWKQQLQTYLNKCYSQIHDEFLVNPVLGNLTRLQTAEDDIKNNTNNAIKRLIENHKDNLDKQLQLLEEQLKADADTRKKLAEEVVQLQAQWKPIHDMLCTVKSDLTKFEKISN